MEDHLSVFRNTLIDQLGEIYDSYHSEDDKDRQRDYLVMIITLQRVITLSLMDDEYTNMEGVVLH